jgi:hypothetical protein
VSTALHARPISPPAVASGRRPRRGKSVLDAVGTRAWASPPPSCASDDSNPLCCCPMSNYIVDDRIGPSA